MSGVVIRPRPVRPRGAPPPALARARTERPRGDSLAVRLTTFAALGAFGAGHWAGLVADPPVARVALTVATAAAGAGALGVLARARLRAAVRSAAATACGLLTGAVGLVAVGLPVRLLLPEGWAELADGIDRGFSSLRTVNSPYGGEDDWVRLVILMGAPLLLALAAVLAFWPARRRRALLRAVALIVLLTLYGVAVTERDPGEPLLRGFLLLVLIAAWLWLPRLRPRDAAPGAALVAAVGACALPVAAKLDADSPWWDWQSWSWFGGGEQVTFDWDHRYGPLDWPRQGTTLLNVKSDRALYWKAENLDRFDGFRWVRFPVAAGSTVASEIPGARTPPGRRWRYGELNPRWDEHFSVTVRGLRTNFVVGAGTTYRVFGAGATVSSSDGTMVRLEEPLERGDTYSVRAYAPDPTARQLRGAPFGYRQALTQYTAIFLPGRGESVGGAPRDAARRVRPAPPPAIVPLRGDPLSGSPTAHDRLLRSPYRRMYRLAVRVTGGAPTTYDAVKRLQRHLQRRYRYGERPPSRALPLSAFLFKDRVGYCQQFSGAMALMLRMVGIPSRVAAGFAPGSLNRDTGEYRVRDLDAHSWVEVYFTGIGWVPFDPTPSAAPAEAQLSGLDRGAGARSQAGEAPHEATIGSERGVRRGSAGGTSGGGRVGLWALPAALFVLALAGAGWLVLRARLGRTALSRDGTADWQVVELEAALLRLGWGVPAGTTLLALERRLRRAVGPGAARYVERLRACRYGARRGRGPRPEDRRALRRELGAAGGARGRLRAFLALPPGGPTRPAKRQWRSRA